MTHLTRRLVRGTVAGAVGTLALDVTTYLDMALRGRPASSTPQQVAERVVATLRLHLPDDPDRRQARLTGLGSVLGAMAGVSAGALLALLERSGRPRSAPGSTAVAWVLAMLVGNGPMTLFGITDPRTWSRTDWAADVVPHLSYAVAATATLRGYGSRR